jgi:hypothetical protein
MVTDRGKLKYLGKACLKGPNLSTPSPMWIDLSLTQDIYSEKAGGDFLSDSMAVSL